MRVWDAKHSIYGALRALPPRRYLCAMWILGEELRSLYADRASDSELSLISQTLNAVREAATMSEAATETAGMAAGLTERWQRLIRERENDVLPGQWNAWVTFESLAAELAGEASQYQATERLTKAAIERWREPYPGKARRIDPNEQIDDAGPMARILARFGRVVEGISKMPELPWDPVVVREILQ